MLHVSESSAIQAISSSQPYQNRSNTIRSIRGRRNTCNNVSCDCSCHSATSYQTPTFFKALIGALFVGYSGIPVMTSKCSNDTCKSRIKRTVDVVYCFPQWFIAHAVHFVAVTKSVGVPVYGLSFPRVMPWGREDNILRPALTGNTEGLKVLLDKKVADVMDVDPDYGRTALHVRGTVSYWVNGTGRRKLTVKQYAVWHKRIDTCKFLLAAGADPDLIDQRNM